MQWNGGAIAQLGERLLCKQEVIGSIPFTSTILVVKRLEPRGSRTRHEVSFAAARKALDAGLLIER